MKIVVFGATGIVGKAVVSEALRKGHEVTVLTRNAGKVTIRHEHLHIAEGDVMDRSVVRSVLKGKKPLSRHWASGVRAMANRLVLSRKPTVSSWKRWNG